MYPCLGIGLGYRRELRRHLARSEPGIDYLEVIADHYLEAPSDRLAELDRLRAERSVVLHGLSLSLGSADGLDEAYLDGLARLVERVEPPWFSEHLGFTRAGGLDLGHFAPLPFTWESVEVVRRNLARARARLAVPILLENITAPFLLPGAEMSEPEFLAAVLDGSDAGLLLDLTNLHVNATDQGFDVESFLAAAPLGRVVEIHVAGVRPGPHGLIDSHDAPVPEPVWALVEHVLATAPVRAITLERDERLDAFDEIDADLRRARQVWAVGHADRAGKDRPHPQPLPQSWGRGAGHAVYEGSPSPSIGRGGWGVRAGVPEGLGGGVNAATLAHALTDPAARARTASPSALHVPSERLEAFARALQAKRRQAVARALPQSCRLLGERLMPLFADYAAMNPPTPEVRRADVPRFATFAGAALCAGEEIGVGVSGRAVAELMCYEALRHEIARRSPPTPTEPSSQTDAELLRHRPVLLPAATVATFALPVECWRAALGRDPGAPAPGWETEQLLVARFGSEPIVRARPVNAATAWLLAACDGTVSLGEMVRTLSRTSGIEAAEGESAFEAECLSLLRVLERQGLLAWEE